MRNGSGRAGILALAALVGAGVAGCTEEPTAEPTAAEYVDALGAICTEVRGRLDAMEQPTDDARVGAFATEVAEVLRDEAERVRALQPPDDLEDDHRAFIRNTDDQVARWATLATTPSADAAFADLVREIGELTLGRDDLAGEMGVDACRTAPG